MARTDDQLFDGDPIRGFEAVSSAATIGGEYYDFADYVSKTRMSTFWHQLVEVLDVEPRSVLEVGIGARVVAGTLREHGIALTTVDVNAALAPDHVCSVLQLDDVVDANQFDVVLCARVLHHLPFGVFDDAVAQLARAARSRVVLTLPVDEARVYVAARWTAGRYRIASLKVPRRLKRLALRFVRSGDQRYRQLWKVDSHDETAAREIRAVIERHCRVVTSYPVPEDRSHAVFVLEPIR